MRCRILRSRLVVIPPRGRYRPIYSVDNVDPSGLRVLKMFSPATLIHKNQQVVHAWILFVIFATGGVFPASDFPITTLEDGSDMVWQGERALFAFPTCHVGGERRAGFRVRVLPYLGRRLEIGYFVEITEGSRFVPLFSC